MKRPRWGLSSKGWALVFLFSLTTVFAIIAGIHPFLAQNKPVKSTVLVVEAWLPEYALHQAGMIFKKDGYQELYVTGGPFKSGVELDADDHYPHRANKYFRKIGITNAVPISFKNAKRDRTFSSATALKKYLDQAKGPLDSFNLVTLGPHARRSRMLFQKAFGSGTRVGIISLSNREYKTPKWWRYSEGVREVLGEAIALAYSVFLFRPEED